MVQRMPILWARKSLLEETKMRMETRHSKAHGVGYMGICHGADPAVDCKRCGILCEFDGYVRCFQKRFGDGIERVACMEAIPNDH